jgi:hypothetical protein
MKLSGFIYFFIGVLLPTYNLLEWVGQHFGGFIKRVLLKTERDAIVWAHYEKKAIGDGHQPKTPKECDDGHCVKI